MFRSVGKRRLVQALVCGLVDLSAFIGIKCLKPQPVRDRIGSIKNGTQHRSVPYTYLLFMIGDSPG